MRHTWSINGRRVNSLVKSVQRGTIAIASGTSATATITKVDVANAIVCYGGLKTTDTSAFINSMVADLTLTDSTTLTINEGSNSGFTLTIAYTVIEFWPGVLRSVQYSRITIAISGTSQTATITAVDTNLAAVFWLGQSTIGAAGATDYGQEMATVVLTNATTLTATRNEASAISKTVSCVTVEFF